MAAIKHKQEKPILPDDAKRLRIIYEEWAQKQPEKKTLRSIEAFARFIGIGKVTLYYQLNGTYPVSKTVINAACLKLNYHPEWVINGRGRKHAAASDKKLMTDIQQLTVKTEMQEQYIFRLEARMKGLEKELNDLKSKPHAHQTT